MRAALLALRQGDPDSAGRMLSHHLSSDPNDAMAHRALALVCSQRGDRAAALCCMEQAIRLDPGSALLHSELGRLQASSGDLAAATASFQRTIDLAPDAVDGWFFLGITLQQCGQEERALPFLRKAYALAPQVPEVLRAVAECEFAAGLPEDALGPWQELLKRHPLDPAIRLRTGETLSRLGQHEEAIAIYRNGLQHQAHAAELWLALAQAEDDAGHREMATQAHQQALRLRPRWPPALAGLLSLNRRQASDELVELATTTLERPLPDPDRALLGFELGKVLDARGRYQEAMACWHAANAARRRQCGPMDAACLTEQVERLISGFSREMFTRDAGHGSADTRPVFIVGMPRSGTTLTEQILAAHPDAHGCGELPHLALIARGIPMPWSGLSDKDRADQARRYLVAAERHAPPGSRRLIDKAPLNFFQLGLAALLFPAARVIWCRRDPRDVAISIYSENFALESTFATDLGDIGRYIDAQERLMRHWQQVLPLPILELQYEALVRDPGGQAKRLVEFSGLDWTPDCLQFHRSKSGVQTPSRWQVREPMHTRSVERWRNYVHDLGPLREVLHSAF